MDYPIIIAPLSEEDGGGYVGYVPDLPGCMSDGETPEEALANTRDAIVEWLDLAVKRGDFAVPTPNSRSAKLAEERRQLVELVRRMAEGYQVMGEELADLKRQIQEVQEQIEHAEAWDRFAQVTGVPVFRIEHKARARVQYRK